MTTDEIRRRLIVLQNHINSLATLLPDYAQIEFRTVDYTDQSDIAERKRLVISVTEIKPDIGADLIERAKGKRAQ
jgi:hypothetical protein